MNKFLDGFEISEGSEDIIELLALADIYDIKLFNTNHINIGDSDVPVEKTIYAGLSDMVEETIPGGSNIVDQTIPGVSGMVVMATKNCRVDLHNCGPFHHFFPQSGFYPDQADLIRDEFFPGEEKVTLKMLKIARVNNPNLSTFFRDLVKKKEEVGGSRAPHLEAINSMCQVLRTEGGGNKMRAEDKYYFISLVGEGDWNLALRRKSMANQPGFRKKYEDFCKNYKSKHVADMRISAVIKEHRKKEKKRRGKGI